MTYDELEAENEQLRQLSKKLADALFATVDYSRPIRKRSKREASDAASALWVKRMDALMDYVALYGNT